LRDSRDEYAHTRARASLILALGDMQPTGRYKFGGFEYRKGLTPLSQYREQYRRRGRGDTETPIQWVPDVINSDVGHTGLK